MDIEVLLTDLADEGVALDRLVAGLDADGWATPTPAPGWTVAHQIAHLAWTDEIATLSAAEPDRFTAWLATVTDPAIVDNAAADGADRPGLLDRWRTGRANLAAALRTVDPAASLPWLGPPMRATSMATARLMETWAHGQDVADALAVTREPTARLRHVAHLAVRTRDFAYRTHGLPVPDAEFRVELSAPDGRIWTWGPEDADQRITGPALDFCLIAVQRRHPADTAVTAEGVDAGHWLGIAQAFAGPPGSGRHRAGAR